MQRETFGGFQSAVDSLILSGLLVSSLDLKSADHVDYNAISTPAR